VAPRQVLVLASIIDPRVAVVVEGGGAAVGVAVRRVVVAEAVVGAIMVVVVVQPIILKLIPWRVEPATEPTLDRPKLVAFTLTIGGMSRAKNVTIVSLLKPYTRNH
jgi:hypothetical protein